MYSLNISLYSLGTCQRGMSVLELAPMKNGFSVAGRFILWFLCMEIVGALVLAAEPLIESAAGRTAFALEYWAGYALESLPLSVIAAVLMSGFTASRRFRHRVSGYILLYILSLSCLEGGVYLSRGLAAPPEPFPAVVPSVSPAGQPLPHFVRASSGDKASGIVYVREAGQEPRLAWAASGTYLFDRGILQVGKTELTLPKATALATSAPIPGLREFRTWYLSLGSENFYLALAAAAGAAALICGLWPLSRLFRWPLVGAFAAGAAVILLGSFHALFRSQTARDLAGLVGIVVPAPLLVGILSGACGLALVLMDFALNPSIAGARRNRGRPR